MKKHVIRAAVLLAVLLVVSFACGMVYGVWRQGRAPAAAQLPPLEADAQRDFMRAELVYDEGTRTLRGTQTLKATNRTGAALSEIVFRLHPVGEGADGVAVMGVTADGQSVPFERDEDDDTLLRIAQDFQPGQTVDISFTLMLTHEKTDGAAIVSLPSLAMIRDGAWQTDLYDPLAGAGCTQAFDYAITLSAHGTQYTAQMRGARDASFALLPGGNIRQREIGGVLTTALASSPAQADKLLARAEEALDDLAGLGLSYPFEALTVVLAETGREDGAAFSGLIAVGEKAEKETLLRRMTRLIARQTFGVLVGSDAYGAPWLSHTLASTAELLAFRMRKGEAAFETRFFEEIEIATRLTRPYGVTVGAGVERFGSDAEMTQVLRDQGAAMMLGVGEAIGYDALAQALCIYARDNAGKIAGRQALEAALESVSGSSWTGYFDDELSY